MARRGRIRERNVRQSRLERGAVMVEFALVFPLLMLLFLGTITSGLAFDRSQSLAHSAREASRFAATLPVPAGGTTEWLDEVAAAAVDNADGNLAATSPGQYLCVALIRDSGTHRRLEISGVVNYDQARCFDDAVDGRRVQVVSQREATIELMTYTPTVTLTKRASARYEVQQ